MKYLKVLTFGACFLLCLFSYAGAALADGKPGIRLFMFNGDAHIEQSSQDPLLLRVAIDNAAAIMILSDNARNQSIIDQYSKTEAYKAFSAAELDAFSKDYPIRQAPEITLGSETVALQSLINLQLRDAAGNSVDIVSRSLASNDQQKKAITLTADTGLLYQFVVDTKQLAQLSEGRYHLAVGIDSTVYNDMWQGIVYSNSATFSLSSAHPDASWPRSNQRAQFYSRYLLDDKQFAKAEQHAREWIKRYAESVNAYHSLGLALFKQNKSEQALEALNQALANFSLKYGDSPPELPLRILNLIEQVEALL